MPRKAPKATVQNEPGDGTQTLEEYRKYLLTPLEKEGAEKNTRPDAYNGILPIIVSKTHQNNGNRLLMPAVYLKKQSGIFWSTTHSINDYGSAAFAKVQAAATEKNMTLEKFSNAIISRDEKGTRHQQLIKEVHLTEKQRVDGQERLNEANKNLTALITAPILSEQDRQSPINITACCVKLFDFWHTFLLAHTEVGLAQANIDDLNKKIKGLFDGIASIKREHSDGHQDVESLYLQLLNVEEIQQMSENTLRHIRLLQANESTDKEIANARDPKRQKTTTTNTLVVLKDGDPKIEELENSMNADAGASRASD